jgi:hypothetical protein
MPTTSYPSNRKLTDLKALLNDLILARCWLVYLHGGLVLKNWPLHRHSNDPLGESAILYQVHMFVGNLALPVVIGSKTTNTTGYRV